MDYRRITSFTFKGDPVITDIFLEGYAHFTKEDDRRFMFTINREGENQVRITPTAFTTSRSVIEFFDLFLLDQNELLNKKKDNLQLASA